MQVGRGRSKLVNVAETNMLIGNLHSLDFEYPRGYSWKAIPSISTWMFNAKIIKLDESEVPGKGPLWEPGGKPQAPALGSDVYRETRSPV